MPLFTVRESDGAQVSIGRLEIIALANDPTVYERISDLSEKLIDLGPHIDSIIADLELQHRGHQLPEKVVLAPTVVTAASKNHPETSVASR